MTGWERDLDRQLLLRLRDGRIKALFQHRYVADTGTKAMLPSPAWSHGAKG